MTTPPADRFAPAGTPEAGSGTELSPQAAALLEAVLGLEPDVAHRIRVDLPRRRGPARGGGRHGPVLDLGS